MRRYQSSVWIVRHLALVLAAVLLGGCSDREPTAPAMVLSTSRAVMAVDPVSVDEGWNYFTADEQFVVDGPMTGLNRSDLRISRAQRIERTLNDDHWTTNTFLQPYRPFGPVPPGGPVRSEIVRITSIDDGSTPRFFNSSGAEINSIPTDLGGDLSRGIARASVVPPGADTVPRQLTGSAGGPAAPTDGAKKKRPTDRRAWLDEIVVTQAARGRVLAQLEKRFGNRGSAFGKLLRHVETRGDVITEHLVDPDIGAIVETNIAERGKLRLHVTRTYAKMTDGSGHVLARTRVQILPKRGGVPTTTEILVTNVRVSRIGGSN